MSFSGRKKEFPSLKAPRPVVPNRNDARGGFGNRRGNRRVATPSAGVSRLFLETLGWLLLLAVGVMRISRGTIRFFRELFSGEERPHEEASSPPVARGARRDPVFSAAAAPEEAPPPPEPVASPPPTSDPTDQAATLRHLYESRQRTPPP